MKLFIEVDTDEAEDAPLSETELARVEKAIAFVRDGEFKVTDDPVERDRWLEGQTGVMFYRKDSGGT
jgi:hypothetical protein